MAGPGVLATSSGMRAYLAERRLTLWRLGIIVVGLGLWELVMRAGLIDPLFLSAPSAIWAAMDDVLRQAPIRQAFAITAYELAIAFALAVALGLVVGLPVGFSPYLYRVTHPILVMFFSVPQVTIFPLFVLYFGIGVNSKIAFGVSHGFFPIALNAIAAARSLDASLVVISRSMGASKAHLLWKVVLPSILPILFTGFRLGMNHTLLGVVLAELFASQKGIGHYITLLTSSFQTAQLYAIIAVVAAFAILVNEGLRAVERQLSLWRLG